MKVRAKACLIQSCDGQRSAGVRQWLTFQTLHLLVIQPPSLLLVLQKGQDGEHQSLHISHCCCLLYTISNKNSTCGWRTKHTHKKGQV